MQGKDEDLGSGHMAEILKTKNYSKFCLKEKIRKYSENQLIFPCFCCHTLENVFQSFSNGSDEDDERIFMFFSLCVENLELQSLSNNLEVKMLKFSEDYLKKTIQKEEILDKKLVTLKSIELLIILVEFSHNVKDSGSFLQGIENLLCNFIEIIVLKGSSEYCISFMELLISRVEKNNIKIFSCLIFNDMLLSKIMNLCEFISNHFLALSKSNQKGFLNFFLFLVSKYLGNPNKLNSNKIFLKIIEKNDDPSIIQKYFQNISEKIENSHPSIYSTSEKIKLLSLFLHPSLDSNILLNEFRKISQKFWENIENSTENKENVLKILESSETLKDRLFTLEIPEKWLSKGFNMLEFKYILKICLKVPESAGVLLKAVSNSFDFLRDLVSFINVEENFPIMIKFIKKVTQPETFLFSFRIFPIKSSADLLEIIFSKTRKISLQLKNKCLSINTWNYSYKGNYYVESSKWCYLRLCLHQNYASHNEIKLHLHIDSLKVEINLPGSGKIRMIKKIKVQFEGGLEFYKIFSSTSTLKCNNNSFFETSEFSQVFSLSCNNYEYNKNIIKNCSINLTSFWKGITRFDLETAIGSLYNFLPILEKCNDFVVFESFFKILKEIIKNSSVNLKITPKLIKWTRNVLSEKTHLASQTLLDLIGQLINDSRYSPCYFMFFENLLLNIEFWKNLDENNFLIYLEIIRISVSDIKPNIFESFLEIFIDFFANISKKSMKNTESFIFQIIFIILKKSDLKSKFSIFLKLFPEILKNSNIENQELNKFFSSIKKMKFEIIDIDQIGLLIDYLTKTTKKILQINSYFIFDFILTLIKIFSRLSKKKLKVSQDFKSKLSSLLENNENTLLIKAFLEFMSTDVVAESDLITLMNCYTSNLCFENSLSLESTEQNFQMINEFYTTHDNFRKALCSQEDFPAWIINLMTPVSIKGVLKETVVRIFSYPFRLANLDALKNILGILCKFKEFSMVMTITSEISSNYLSTPDVTKIEKFIVEIFNICEDLTILVPYDLIPSQEFFGLVRYLILLAKKSLCTVNKELKEITFNDLEHLKNFTIQQEFREGGQIRQLLLLCLIALSLGPDNFIEDFFLEFKCKDIPCFNRTLRSHIVDLEDILNTYTDVVACFFIYIEWFNIIRSYSSKNIPFSNIQDSMKNFKEFIDSNKIFLRMKTYILENLTFKDVKFINQKILEDSKLFTFPYQFDETIHKFKDCKMMNSVLETLQNGEEPKLAEIKFFIEQHFKKLEKLTISEVIESTENHEIQIHVLLKGLTTLKVRKISEYYFNQEKYNFKKKSVYRRSSTQVHIFTEKFLKKCQKPLENFEKTRKIIYSFIGISNENINNNGKFVLRNYLDRQGKPVLFKKSENKVCHTENTISKNTQFLENYFKQDISEIIHKVSIQKIIDKSLNKYSESAPLNIKKFKCELIKIEGTIFGSLNLTKDHMIFLSSMSRKPEIAPILVSPDKSKNILCSSSLSEYQIFPNLEKKWFYNDIKKIQIKTFNYSRSSLEIYLKTGKSFLLNFFHVYLLLDAYSLLKFRLNQLKIATIDPWKEFKDSQNAWIQRKISNFEYLLIINNYASRSFQNLNQYPIFPWVLKDYSSETLDLNDEKVFRDLSLPISAQTQNSQKELKKRFNHPAQDPLGKYHFGSHYSAGALILNYLVRIEPFTDQNKELNNKCFDLPDRIFSSVKSSWDSGQKILIDPKELIPEFFYMPEVFFNKNQENFGNKQNGEKVNHVELPNWAENNVYKFLFIHRKALESEYVSKNLNFWIDLIFGFRQGGESALEKFNIFHPLTYARSFCKILHESPEDFRSLYYRQAVLFGQTPARIFKYPHPKRKLPEKDENISDIIFSKNYSLTKKIRSPNRLILLTNETFLLILAISEKINLYKWKISSSQVCLKENDLVTLSNVQGFANIRAVLYKNSFIFTAGYSDYSTLVHNLEGELEKKLTFHTSLISDIIGGDSIISASCDSSLIRWVDGEITDYKGHMSRISSVTLMTDLEILASCSDYLLLHNISGKLIKKIEGNYTKIFSNSFGLLCAAGEDCIKIFHINGDLVTTFNTNPCMLLSFFNDVLVLKYPEYLKLLKIFSNEIKLFEIPKNESASEIYLSPFHSFVAVSISSSSEVGIYFVESDSVKKMKISNL